MHTENIHPQGRRQLPVPWHIAIRKRLTEGKQKGPVLPEFPRLLSSKKPTVLFEEATHALTGATQGDG